MSDTKKKGQLHQLFPVEHDLQVKSNNLVLEAISTFRKPERFDGFVKTLKMFDDARSGEETTDIQEITTTVGDKLTYVFDTLITYWDAFTQKERTNQEARADVIIGEGDDEIVLLKDVPATALLGLEKRLEGIRKMIESIPTLTPGMKWEESKDIPGVWICPNDEVKMKTEKDVKFKSVAKATDHHPEQVEKWTADIPVGQYITSKTTARLSPGDKSQLFGRIDAVLLAVKKARTVANSVDIVKIEVGKKIADFILGPIRN